LILKILKDH